MLPDYRNPKLPERVNSGKDRPVVDFIIQGVALLFILVGIILTILVIADFGAPYTPFEWEERMAEAIPIYESEHTSVESEADLGYLQDLVERLTPHMNLPEEMTIKVHYSEAELVNAYAWLGGHIVIFKGLLDDMPNENALAFVVAHEIGHIKERHVIRNMSGQIILAIAFSAMFGDAGSGSALATETSRILSLGYSRRMERTAEKQALYALHKLYGHVDGIDDAFDVLAASVNENTQPPELLSSHPDPENRVDELMELAEHLGMMTSGEMTNLP